MANMQPPTAKWVTRLSELVHPDVIDGLKRVSELEYHQSLYIFESRFHGSEIEVVSLGSDDAGHYCEFCKFALSSGMCDCCATHVMMARQILVSKMDSVNPIISKCVCGLTNVYMPIIAGEYVIACVIAGQILCQEDKMLFIEYTKKLTKSLQKSSQCHIDSAVHKKLATTEDSGEMSPNQLTEVLQHFALIIESLAEDKWHSFQRECELEFHAWARSTLGTLETLRIRDLSAPLNRLCSALLRFRAIQYVIVLLETDPPGILRPISWAGPSDWAGPHAHSVQYADLFNLPIGKPMHIVHEGIYLERFESLGKTAYDLFQNPLTSCLIIRTDAGPTLRGAWIFANSVGLPIPFGQFSDSISSFLLEVVKEVSWRIRIASLVETREQLLAKFAHEIANSLSGVKGSLQRAVKFSTNDSEVMSLLLNALNACDLVIGIRDTIYDSEAGDLRITTTPTMVFNDIIIQCLGNIQREIEERGYRAIINIETITEIPCLMLDRYRVTQAIINILNNAAKYAKPSSKVCRICVVTEAGDEDYLIKFQDWGIGIEDDEGEDIFCSCFRGRCAHMYDVKGLGFGLTIAHKVILAHGGRLELTSHREPTEFTIKFPKHLQYMKGSTHESLMGG